MPRRVLGRAKGSTRAPVAAGIAAILFLVGLTVGPWFAGRSGAASSRPGDVSAETRRSGFDDMGRAIQAMQRDDTQNPAMLTVADGAAAWDAKPASGGPSCAGCHGEGATRMRGVAARHPAWDEHLGRPLTLQQRIDQCRVRNQGLPPAQAESETLLALETFVAQQSRGSPITPPDDSRLDPWRARGASLFAQRIGQIDLSCRDCHDLRAGARLGGSPIPQGHPTGYPIYRLEWQGVGSLQRRLRNCTVGVRAEPFGYGSEESVALELYLAQRASGMEMETPAVRP